MQSELDAFLESTVQSLEKSIFNVQPATLESPEFVSFVQRLHKLLGESYLKQLTGSTRSHNHTVGTVGNALSARSMVNVSQ
jgi:hypothetical protein